MSSCSPRDAAFPDDDDDDVVVVFVALGAGVVAVVNGDVWDVVCPAMLLATLRMTG